MLLFGLLLGMTASVYQVNIAGVGIWIGIADTSAHAITNANSYFGVTGSPPSTVIAVKAGAAFGGYPPGNNQNVIPLRP